MAAEATQRFGILLVLFGMYMRIMMGPLTSPVFVRITGLGFLIAIFGLIAHVYSIGQGE